LGVSKYDKTAQHKRLEQRYALDNAKGVRLILRDIHALYERQYKGDTSAVDVLADLNTAIERANLTDRQRQALALVYVEDLTQEAAGERVGIRQDNVARLLSVGETKIARVYEYWARHGEGYSINSEEDVVV
jgi:DNA-directed RNA polymerase specialized sigma24 family protein